MLRLLPMTVSLLVMTLMCGVTVMVAAAQQLPSLPIPEQIITPPPSTVQPVPGERPTVPPPVGTTFQDRAVRCSHYGGLSGVPADQMGRFVHDCATAR